MVALTVRLLAARPFARAALLVLGLLIVQLLAECLRVPLENFLLLLFDLACMLGSVVAANAGAVLSAELVPLKALAVHLEALCLCALALRTCDLQNAFLGRLDYFLGVDSDFHHGRLTRLLELRPLRRDGRKALLPMQVRFPLYAGDGRLLAKETEGASEGHLRLE